MFIKMIPILKYIEKGGNYSLSHKHKEEIQVIFHKSMDLLTSRILNNNKGGS